MAVLLAKAGGDVSTGWQSEPLRQLVLAVQPGVLWRFLKIGLPGTTYVGLQGNYRGFRATIGVLGGTIGVLGQLLGILGGLSGV